MSKRKASKSTNSRKGKHREISRSCKLRNRIKDLDEIRKNLETGEAVEELEQGQKYTKCIECDRLMESKTLEKHVASRAHRRRLKDLEEDALLEQERRAGMF